MTSPWWMRVLSPNAFPRTARVSIMPQDRLPVGRQSDNDKGWMRTLDRPDACCSLVKLAITEPASLLCSWLS